jgi:biopolymer transport protein ExbB/TolQ
MNAVRLWFAEGGMTMAALGLVAAVLAYLILERLLAIRSAGRLLESAGALPGGAVLDAMALRGLRRMGFIRACIVVAPLLGLLGTVTGMIETFESILVGGSMTAMSEGIRKALLTTQYGLAIAAPGLLAEQVLLRQQERLDRLVRAARLRPLEGPSCVEAC